MIDLPEIGLLLGAAVFLICGFTSRLRTYRSLFWGSSVLLTITALFPRRGNTLGQYLLARPSESCACPANCSVWHGGFSGPG